MKTLLARNGIFFKAEFRKTLKVIEGYFGNTIINYSKYFDKYLEKMTIFFMEKILVFFDFIEL